MSCEQDDGPRTHRRTHVITFGHPYSCTPVLNRLFEFNPSPSHSQVTKIMQQTGLRRKQITSWFWRKRKESTDVEQPSSSGFDRQYSSRSHSFNYPCFDPLTRTASSSSHKAIRHTKPRGHEDDEYCPPNYLKISSSNRRPLGHTTRIQSRSIGDGQTENGVPRDNSAAEKTLFPSFRSNHHESTAEHLCATNTGTTGSTTTPKRSPVLIRCKLRPLAQRTFNEALEPEREGQDESDGTPDPRGHGATTSESFPSAIDMHPTLREQGSSCLSRHPDLIQHFSITEHTQALPYHLHGDRTFSNQHEALVAEPLQVNAPSRGESDLHHPQVRLAEAMQSLDCANPSTQIEARSSVNSEHWLSQPCHLDSADLISRNATNPFWNSSIESTNSSNSGSSRSYEDIFWHVSPEELEFNSASQNSIISFGHEIDRWSELSEVHGASCYSSDSIESRVVCPTGAGVVDYSALLNSCSDKIIMSDLTPPPESQSLSSTPKENLEFRDNCNRMNLTIGSRYLSHPYRPREQTTRRTSSYKDPTILPLPASAYLVSQPAEVEEDPRLFVWERDCQELSNLFDWNPIS